MSNLLNELTVFPARARRTRGGQSAPPHRAPQVLPACPAADEQPAVAGFVDVCAAATLADVRAAIDKDIDALTGASFAFLWPPPPGEAPRI